MLREADNTSGYANVSLQASGGATPYKVAVRRGGKKVHLGHFATPEEAALCLARWHEKEERNAAAETVEQKLVFCGREDGKLVALPGR